MGSPVLEYACDRFLDNPVLYRGEVREIFVTTSATPDGFAPRLGRFVTNIGSVSLLAFWGEVVPTKPLVGTASCYKMLLKNEPTPLLLNALPGRIAFLHLSADSLCVPQ